MYDPLSFAVVRCATADGYSLLLLLLEPLLLLLLDPLLLLLLDLLLLLLFDELFLLLRSPCAKRAGELL